MSKQPVNEQEQEWIERFLMQRLGKEASQSFDQKMADEAFREEVEWQRQLLDAVKGDAQEQAKAQLQALEQNIRRQAGSSPKPQARRRRMLLLWALAAAIVGLFVAVWVLYTPPSDPEQLFAANFSPYPNELVKIERNDPSLSPRQSTFVAYQAGNFPEAIEGFDRWLAEAPQSDVRFYKAQALMALDRLSEALPILNDIRRQQGHRYQHPAHWYAALIYLQRQEREAAKEALRSLLEEESKTFKKEAATELLRQL